MPSTHPQAAFDVGLILPLIGRVLRARSFIGLLVLGLALTGVRAFVSRPVYRSEAVLLYQDRGSSNPMAPQREAPSARRLGLALQEMLFSHQLMERLIREFGLYPNTVARFGMVGAVEEMQKRDLRFNTREGYTFRISFESTSPVLAEVVTARATQLLTRAHVDARVKEAKETERFLDSEKARVEKELSSRESELTLFVAQHPEVLEINGVRAGALSSGSAGAEAASLGLKMQALQLQARLDQLRRRSMQSSGAPLEISEARSRAEAEVAAAQRELAEKQMQFTEEYPDVKRAVKRLESAKARLRRLEDGSSVSASSQTPSEPKPQAPATSASDQSEIRLLEQQLNLMEKQARAVRPHTRHPQDRLAPPTDPVVLAPLRVQYTELERRTRESRERLNLLESRQFQAEMQSVFTTQAKQADLVVVDPAYKPIAPLRSSRFKILAIGVVGSLLLALSISVPLTLRDDRLRHAADLRRFGLPALLCEVPPP